MPPPPLPSSGASNGKQHHRKTSNASSTQPPLPLARPSSTAPELSNPNEDNWKSRIHQEALAKFRELARLADAEHTAKLRSASRNGFRPGTPTGSMSSSQLLGMTDEQLQRLESEHRRRISSLQRQMEEDVTKAIQREERRRRRSSRSERDRPPKGVFVEEEDTFVVIPSGQSPGGETEEWLWRPDELEGDKSGRKARRRGSERADEDQSRWREAVRQEQQVIWNASAARNGNNGPSPSQLASMNGRKVHWANGGPPPTGRSGSPALPPHIPHTPHTANMNLFHARPMSAVPTHSQQQLQQQHPNGFRAISPVVTMNRPGSARPSSPGYGWRERERERDVHATGHARWIPSISEGDPAMKERQRSAARPIPGRNVSSNAHASHPTQSHGQGPHDAKDSEGSVGSGSVGSWRDWKGPPVVPPKEAQAQAQGMKETPPTRRAMTPAPGMTSSASKYAMAQSGVPPVPDTARMRTLSFNAPSAPKTTLVPPAPLAPAASKSKGKAAIVDDRDDPDEAAAPRVFAVPMTRSSSGLPESDERPPEQVQARRRDKGKGKAPAPPPPAPAMETGRGAGGGAEKGVYSIYAAQLEDFASVLRRELSIASEA